MCTVNLCLSTMKQKWGNFLDSLKSHAPLELDFLVTWNRVRYFLYLIHFFTFYHCLVFLWCESWVYSLVLWAPSFLNSLLVWDIHQVLLCPPPLAYHSHHKKITITRIFFLCCLSCFISNFCLKIPPFDYFIHSLFHSRNLISSPFSSPIVV